MSPRNPIFVVTLLLTSSMWVTTASAQKMYWSQDGYPSGTFRANLDGCNVEHLSIRPAGAIALDPGAGKIYMSTGMCCWGDLSFYRTDLDGSNFETLLSNLEFPGGIALDLCEGKMYWTLQYPEHYWYYPDVPGMINRSNLDGSNTEILVRVSDGVESVSGIALDVEEGKMYWLGHCLAPSLPWSPCYGESWEDETKIFRANLDGSNLEVLVTISFSSPGHGGGLALDLNVRKIYWVDVEWAGGVKIQRANLDGSNVEDLVML